MPFTNNRPTRQQLEAMSKEALIEWVLSHQGKADHLTDIIFETAHMGLAVCDAGGYFIRLNAAFCQTFGYTTAQLAGEHFSSLFPPQREKLAKRMYEHLVATGKYSLAEHKLRHRRGDILDVMVSASRYKDEDGTVYEIVAVTDITEKRQALEKLAKNRKTFRSLVDHLPDMVLRLDRQLRITAANQAAARHLGIPIKQLIGQYVTQTGFDEQTLRQELPHWQSVIDSGQGQAYPATISTISGRHHVYVKLIPETKNGQTESLLVLLEDETELQKALHIAQELNEAQRKQEEVLKHINRELAIRNTELAMHEEELAASNEELYAQQETLRQTMEEIEMHREFVEGIAKAVPAELNAFDVPLGKVVFSNGKLADMLGYNPEEYEALGKDALIKVVHPDDMLRLVEAREMMLRDRTCDHITLELRLMHRSGQVIWTSVSSSAVRDEQTGQTERIVTLIFDTTRIKESEQTYRHQAHELQRVNSELDRFLYSASHDLRAPLSTVLGLINLVRHEEDLGEIKAIADMQEASIHKLDICLHNMSTIGMNIRKKVSRNSINFQEIVHEVLSGTSLLENSDRIHKHVVVQQFQDFQSDRQRIYTILDNLISNAIRYCNPTAKEKFVQIHVTVAEGKAAISVSDNGIGIAREYQDKIFNMFYRATDKRAGSGLGLYIVREAVEKLRGHIRVQSEMDKGTTFFVTLPSL